MSAPTRPIPHWHDPDSKLPTIVDGSGASVVDDDGNEYLDFVAQLFCCNAGHSNEAILEAMSTQAERIPYVSSAHHNDTRSQLAEELDTVTPGALSDVIFAISGSEANEEAAQIAREVMDAPNVLTRWQSYHGSTYATGGFSGDPTTRAKLERYAATNGAGKFLPPLPEAFGTEDPDELTERAADHLEFVVRNEGHDSIAAILMEPIAGASGAYTAPPGYMERVREICDTYDILLIADEVITGFGRCGEWFGIQTEDVVPDMMTFAKGITSAYVPLAGVMLDAEIAEALRERKHKLGQTFAGHPVACAAGLAAIDEYDGGIIDNVRKHSDYLESRLQELARDHTAIDRVRGRGYLWSVVFADPETDEPFVHPWIDAETPNPVPRIRAEALDRGVIFGSGRPDTQILLSPPLIVGPEEIDTAIDALEASIRDVAP